MSTDEQAAQSAQNSHVTGKISVRDGVSFYEPTFTPRVKHPVFEIPVSLLTEPAFRVFQSTYDPVQKALYHLHTTLPILCRDHPKVIDDVLGILSGRFDEIEQEIDAEHERLKHLEKHEGAEPARRYFNEEKLVVVVVTPAMARYLALIGKMDQVMRLVDALWFTTRISDKERNNRIMEWRNKIMRFHRQIGTYHMRALGAANRRENAAHAELQAAGEDLAIVPSAGGKKKAAGKARKTVPKVAKEQETPAKLNGARPAIGVEEPIAAVA